jgi:predicted aspartyl protease/Tfp pilus assembly protein PilF
VEGPRRGVRGWRLLYVVAQSLLLAFHVVPAFAQPQAQQPVQFSKLVANFLAADNYLDAGKILDLGIGVSNAEGLAFRGEIAFRKGQFEEADNFYRSALEEDGLIVRALFGLGKLAMSKQRAAEAIAYFERAIALDAAEPLYRLHASDAYAAAHMVREQRRELDEYLRLKPDDPDRATEARVGIETLDALGAQRGRAIAEIEAPERPAPIPTDLYMNLVYVQVLIDGKGPFVFVLDTGASITSISSKAAAKAGLKPVSVAAARGGGAVEARMYRLDTLQIGDVKIHNLPVGPFDDPSIADVADGVLGMALLSDFQIVIDFTGDRVDLVRRADPPAPSPEDAIPARNLFNMLLVPVTVNGHPGNFLVDTGAAASVLSYSMADELGVTEEKADAQLELPPGENGRPGGSARLVEDVRIVTAATSERLQAMIAIDLRETSRLLGTEVSGVLGHDLLDGYSLVLDYAKPEIHFKGGAPPQ